MEQLIRKRIRRDYIRERPKAWKAQVAHLLSFVFLAFLLPQIRRFKIGPKSVQNRPGMLPQDSPSAIENQAYGQTLISSTFRVFDTKILDGKSRRQFLTKITFLEKNVPESSRSSPGSSRNISSIACGCLGINIGSIPEPNFDQKFLGPNTDI